MKNFNKNITIPLSVLSGLGIIGLVMAATLVNLGTASNFAILAGTGMTNTGVSTISGDVGSSPTHSETGFTVCPAANCVTLTGTNHNAADPNDAATVLAKTDLVTAYNTAASSTPVTTIPTELGGSIIFAGNYNSLSGTFGITGTTTLDAQGDPNAVFIFQSTSTLITAGASHVSLINGAQACNVFWQVGSSATLGSASVFKGNILALTSASLGNSANVEGRILVQNGAVTLDTNTITTPTCVIPPVVSTPNTSNGGIFSMPWVAPIISVVKVPTPLALPLGPGTVTYDYTVSNIGTVPMSNVTVTDNKCSPVGYLSGDTNTDLKLDLTEVWHYRCTTTLTQTTTNTVTASGVHDFSTSTATANATVTVGNVAPTTTPQVLGASTSTLIIPTLPNTGLPPEAENSPLIIIPILTGISLMFLLPIILRKKENI